MRRAAAAFAAMLAACSSDKPGGGGPVEPPEDGGGIPLDAGIGEVDGGFHATSLRIAPADPVLTLADGQAGALALAAIATDATGAEQDVTGATLWRAADDALGRMGETTGRFTGSGDRAGTVEIEARHKGLTARATLKVVLAYRRIENGAPPSPDGLFSGPAGTDPMMRPAIAYPANETTIPKNLVPMNLQWDAPAALDVFRVTLSSPLVTVTAFTTASELRVERAVWARLLEAASPGRFRVTVEGTSSADPAHTVHGSLAVEVEVAPALMRGTIYYWALNVGRILRIRPGAEAYEEFFTPPPGPMGSTCVGCHTLSRDGQHMSFEYYGGWQSSGVISVNAPAPPVIGPSVFSSNFSAFDPTGAKLIGVINGALTIRSARDGTAIETLDTGGLATHPAWSPDGDTIAFASQVAGQDMGDVDFFQADLEVFRGVNGMRRGPELLVAAGGMANSYPSFSPDGRIIAYGRGPYSRSHRAFDPPNHTAVIAGELWMIATAGGAPVRLERASDGGQAYLPAYSPFSGGGFTWIAFFSRKDYGRVTRGTTRRQIWVTAIDERRGLTADPSRPAFWLPAQDPSTENMSAYWAPDPCRAADQACSLDEDCCSGYLCRPVASGERRCVSRADACRIAGEPCASSSECCAADRLQCIETQSGPRCGRIDL